MSEMEPMPKELIPARQFRFEGLPPKVWEIAESQGVDDNLLLFIDWFIKGDGAVEAVDDSGEPAHLDLWQFMHDNLTQLHLTALYEPVLIRAISDQGDNRGFDTTQRFIAQADRSRLVAAGDPMANSETFKLYRSIRKGGEPSGLCWSDELDFVAWRLLPHIVKRESIPFGDSTISINTNAHEIEIYSVDVAGRDILYFLDRRNGQEREYVVDPRKCSAPSLVTDSPFEVRRLALAFQKRIGIYP